MKLYIKIIFLLLISNILLSQNWKIVKNKYVPINPSMGINLRSGVFGTTGLILGYSNESDSGTIRYNAGSVQYFNGSTWLTIFSSADTSTLVTKNTPQVITPSKYWTARQYMTSLAVDTVVAKSSGNKIIVSDTIYVATSLGIRNANPKYSLDVKGGARFYDDVDVDTSLSQLVKIYRESGNARISLFNGDGVEMPIEAGDEYIMLPQTALVIGGSGAPNYALTVYDSSSMQSVFPRLSSLYKLGNSLLKWDSLYVNSISLTNALDTAQANSVSKLTAGYGITATKNAKDYTVLVDSATLRSKFIPYSGANASINLGSQTVTTTGAGSFGALSGTTGTFSGIITRNLTSGQGLQINSSSLTAGDSAGIMFGMQTNTTIGGGMWAKNVSVTGGSRSHSLNFYTYKQDATPTRVLNLTLNPDGTSTFSGAVSSGAITSTGNSLFANARIGSVVSALIDSAVVDSSALEFTVGGVDYRALQNSYGELYISADPDTITMATAGVYYTTKDLDAGISKYVSVGDSSMTIKIAGYYHVTVSSSMTHSTNNTIVHFSFFKNDVEEIKMEAERKIGTGGDFGNASASGVLYLAANDIIKIKYKADNNGTAIVNHFNFTVHRVD